MEKSIARHEGADVVGSLPNRQHNPCALLYKNQISARRGMNGYATFRTRTAGENACRWDLSGKFAAGLDVDQVLGLWNGGVYAESLKRETGLRGSDRLYSEVIR